MSKYKVGQIVNDEGIDINNRLDTIINRVDENFHIVENLYEFNDEGSKEILESFIYDLCIGELKEIDFTFTDTTIHKDLMKKYLLHVKKNHIFRYFVSGVWTYIFYKSKYYTNGKICCVDYSSSPFIKWYFENGYIWSDTGCVCGDKSGYKSEELGEYHHHISGEYFKRDNYLDFIESNGIEDKRYTNIDKE